MVLNIPFVEVKRMSVAADEPVPKRARLATTTATTAQPQVLYPHQRECVEWMKTRRPRGGLLYLPPGMGKTLIAMTWLRHLLLQSDGDGDGDGDGGGASATNDTLAMIIVPKTLQRQWETELTNFGLEVVTLPTMQPMQPKMVVLTTYSQVQALYTAAQKPGKEAPWRAFCQYYGAKANAFVLDECHVARNKDTIIFKALKALTTSATSATSATKWCMSGTPCVNWPEKDFASMAALIGCDKRDIMTHVFRREKSLLPLPPCTVEIIPNHFSVRERQRYDDYRLTTADVILTKLYKLRAYCRNVTAKFNKVQSILSLSPPGTKTLVFSESVQCLRNIQEFLIEKNPYQADETLLFHGKLSLEERQATLAEFAQNPRKKVLLLSIHCGGVGLNITCASNVILMDTQYAEAFEQQAIDRAHRIGQTRPVHVYKLRMNDSVENWVQGLQNSKSSALTTFFMPPPPPAASARAATAAEEPAATAAEEPAAETAAQSLKKQQKDLFKQFVHCEATSAVVAEIADVVAEIAAEAAAEAAFVATEKLFDAESDMEEDRDNDDEDDEEL